MKKEILAYAVAMCMSPERLTDAYIEGCSMPREFADALQITAEAFYKGMEHQKRRYRTRRCAHRGYCLTFVPIRIEAVREAV